VNSHCLLYGVSGSCSRSIELFQWIAIPFSSVLCYCLLTSLTIKEQGEARALGVERTRREWRPQEEERHHCGGIWKAAPCLLTSTLTAWFPWPPLYSAILTSFLPWVMLEEAAAPLITITSLPMNSSQRLRRNFIRHLSTLESDFTNLLPV